jgi:glutathione S-transferase
MLTLFYCPNACSMAPHLVLEEGGEKYKPYRVNCAGGEQRSEGYLKINPHARVPALGLDDGSYISENIAILPFLGKRLGLWTDDPVTEARMLSFIGWVASTVHPAQAHYRRPYRYASDPATHPDIQRTGLAAFRGYLKEVDGMYSGKEYLFGKLSVADFYAFVLHTWGIQRGFDMAAEMPHFGAFYRRMMPRPAVQRVFADEKIELVPDRPDAPLDR